MRSPILLTFALLSLAGCPPDVSGATSCATNADCLGGYFCSNGTCTEIGSCTPQTCASLAKNCDAVPDGCGGMLSCGSCQSPLSCGGGGVANVCGQGGCTPENDPTFCSRLGRSCGPVTASDNCGATRTADCGGCTTPQTCGGGGVDGLCGQAGCTSETSSTFCARLGKNCDNVSADDNCGVTRTVSCGTCTSPDTCGGAGAANVCGRAACTLETNTAFCARLGKNCNDVTANDNCGNARTVNCGACAMPQTCGGGGVTNVCGSSSCTAETNAAFCSRLGKTCGSVTAADNCGASRTVSCGSCPTGQSCGATNVCACTPETDAQLCSRLSLTCGSFTGMDNCGTVRTVSSCGTCAAGQLCGGGGVPANTCGCGACGANAHCDSTAKACVCDSGFVGDGQSCGLKDRCTGRVPDPSSPQVCFYSPVAPLEELFTVQGFAATDVWAASYDHLYKWDGTAWTVTGPTPSSDGAPALWGMSDDDLWMAGGTTVLHKTATGWADLTPATGYIFTSVSGTGPGNVWVVGYANGSLAGYAFHWTGASWSAPMMVSTNMLSDVWAGATEAWAVGPYCTIARWNGSSWSPVSLTGLCSGATYVDSVSATGPNDLWFVTSASTVLRYNGVSWSTIASPGGVWLNAVAPSSPTQAIAVGTAMSGATSRIYTLSSGSWAPVSSVPAEGGLNEVWVTGSAGWAVGRNGTFLQYDGANWKSTSSLFKNTALWTALGGSGAGNVMLATGDGVFRWDGTRWGSASAGLTSSFVPADIWVNSPSEAWLIAGSSVLRWNGTAWQSTGSLPSGASVYAIWASGPSSAWAVGAQFPGTGGGTFRWNGTSWSAVTNPALGSLLDVWGSGANDVWAIGDRGGTGTDVIHWNGAAWAAVATTLSRPRNISGSSATEIFVIDSFGTNRLSGTSWVLTPSAQPSLYDTKFHSVWSVGPGKAWAVRLSTDGRIYEWDGAVWTHRALVGTFGLSDVFATSAGDVWAAGNSGALVTNRQ